LHPKRTGMDYVTHRSNHISRPGCTNALHETHIPTDAKTEIRCNVSWCVFYGIRTGSTWSWKIVCRYFTPQTHQNAPRDPQIPPDAKTQVCQNVFRCVRATSGRVSPTRISLSDSRWSENTINAHEYNNIYWSSSISYYKLGLHFKLTKGWSPKEASKDITDFVEGMSLTFKTLSSP
jgi:hypothetical protein